MNVAMGEPDAEALQRWEWRRAGNRGVTFADPFGLCKDERGNERPCKVEWAAEASNTNVTPAMTKAAQAIADKADVDLLLSSGRRAEGDDCTESLHDCGKAVDIKGINGTDVGSPGQANPDAMDLVRRVQGVAMGMSEVRENMGPMGLWKAPASGRAQALIGIVIGQVSFFTTDRARTLWNPHQNHIHIGIW